ncbi:glyoxalase superfamily protein [Undibacterium sp. TJN25]|uniref:glyoxalase superfamily protein n=1 Tax=Undibacterium sp. TJN25 TaxID=3413056 RepID=UPI003BF3DE08
MSLGKTVPILRVFDEAKAKEFYLDFLGFRLDWEHRFEDGLPLYMQVSRDECVLHLSEHFGDGSPGVHLRIAINGIGAIDTYQQQLLAKQFKHSRPGIEKKPWGTREMQIADPFGNRLSFHADDEPDA